MAKRDVDIFINARDRASVRFKMVNKNYRSMASTIRSSAGLITTALTAGFAARFTNQLITQADQIGKVAKRIGITAEEYQKYTFAARRAGATNSDIEKSFKRLQKNVNDAEKGLTTAKDAFAQVGVSLDQLRGKKPSEQFNLVADALNRVENESEKAALAQDLFGRAGTALIPMLDTYKELGDEAERNGRIMSEESVKAAEDYKDAMENLNSTMKATIANSKLIPSLADAVGGVDELVKSKNALRLFLDAATEVFTGDQGEVFLEAPDVMEKRKERIRLAKENKKVMMEAFDAFKKAAAESQKIFTAGFGADKETKDIAEDITKALQDRIDHQRLLNAGKEREAFITKSIADAEKKAASAKQELTERELESIRQRAGELFDLQQQATEAKKQTVDLSITPFSPGAQQAQASRFLSFQDTGSREQMARNTEKATQTTADNTEKMLGVMQEALEIQKALQFQEGQPFRAGS